MHSGCCTTRHPTSTKPTASEYPNETWVAQEIRKCTIFHAAWRESQDDREPYRQAAMRFRDYVVDTLSQSEYRHYSRILAILMQSHGPNGCLEHDLPALELPVKATPVNQVGALSRAGRDLGRLLGTWARSVRGFSPAAERAWLRHRLARP